MIGLIHSWLQNSRKTFFRKICQYLYRSTYDPDGKKIIGALKKCITRRTGKALKLVLERTLRYNDGGTGN